MLTNPMIASIFFCSFAAHLKIRRFLKFLPFFISEGPWHEFTYTGNTKYQIETSFLFSETNLEYNRLSWRFDVRSGSSSHTRKCEGNYFLQ